MKPTVLITHRIPEEGLEALFAQTRVLYPDAYRFTEEELLDLAPRVDGVLAGGPVSAAFLSAAKGLRVISNYGAGYDNIDMKAAIAARIPVTTIPGAVSGPTAELAFGLLLAVTRRIAQLSMGMRQEAPESFFGMGKSMGHTLSGRRMSIVGMGGIGQKVARMALAFGMSVRYYNRNRLPVDKEEGAVYAPLDELLAQSDVLTLHCPLTEETRGLIGVREIAKLPQEAVVINTARGGVMDYDALADALDAGALFGAGLDVYPDEPHVPARLLAMDNVVLTPHIGSNTREDRRIMSWMAAGNLLKVLGGERPDSVINPEVWDA